MLRSSTRLWPAGVPVWLWLAASLSAGIWLDLARPIWLKPSVFNFVPAIHALLPLAWLPAMARFARLGASRGRLPVWIAAAFLAGNGLWCILVSPRTASELPYLGANGKLSCHAGDLPQTPGAYQCEHRFESSTAQCIAHAFRLLEKLPFMLLVEQDVIS